MKFYSFIFFGLLISTTCAFKLTRALLGLNSPFHINPTLSDLQTFNGVGYANLGHRTTNIGGYGQLFGYGTNFAHLGNYNGGYEPMVYGHANESPFGINLFENAHLYNGYARHVPSFINRFLYNILF